MKEVKSERERGSRRRHRDGDMVAAATVVVKQERLSPETVPPAHRRPDSGHSQSSPAGEPSRPSHRGNRARGGSRSPAKKKSKSSGRRSKSPRGKRNRSPHHSTVKVKQLQRAFLKTGGKENLQRNPILQSLSRDTGIKKMDFPLNHPEDVKQEDSLDILPYGLVRDFVLLRIHSAQTDFSNGGIRESRKKREGLIFVAVEVGLPLNLCGLAKEEAPVKEKPSFELSGALLEDTNTFRGVVIKYSEPPEARIPKKRWRLYPFKNDEVLPVMYIHRQSAYLLGRHRRIADIPIDHPSCSKQHAVFQYRLVEYTRADGTVGRRVKPYIIDLGSGNGTFLNNKRIEPQRYYELKEKDVLKFGFSSREYVLLHESSDTSEVDRKEDEDDEEEEEVSDS
uniref:Smad nuclear interacting protein 1 n=1 Tax=Loxodonta africana TaxID=9785 RepID=G3TX16_LOXAF